MKRLSKFEIVAGILVPILLLVFVCFCAFIFIMVFVPKTLNIEIEKELSRLEEKGEPVSLKELAPPLVPESENAAFVYEKAFQMIGEIPKEVEALLKKRPSELTSEERTALKNFLDEREAVFPLLDKAMTYERCRFPVDYEEGFLAELPHLSKLRGCARLLALKSLRELNEGKAEQAVNTSLKMIKLSDSLSMEPFLISQLVRISIGHIMMDSLEKVLSGSNLSVETLKSLIERLNAFEKKMESGLRLAFLGERCSFIAIFENPEKFFLVETDLVETDVDIPLSKLRYFMGSRFMRSDKLYGLRIYNKLIDFTYLPLHQAIRESKELGAEVDKRHDEVWKESKFKPWKLAELHILTTIMLPPMSRAFECWARHEAKIKQARIATALELYKREHGIYPEHLRDIPSRILSPLPKDPFTDEDFIYRKEDDRFILYSVGENLKDDGGVAYIRVNRREERPDIVWGQ